MIKFFFKIFVRPKLYNLNDFKRSRKLHFLLSIYNFLFFFLGNLKIKKVIINEIECYEIFEKNRKSLDNIILYFHGGAFSSGSTFSHLNIIYKLSLYTKYTVLSVNYSLAPEHKFPKAQNEALSVYKSIQKNYHKSNIFVGGDSSGGNLALTLILKLKQLNINLPSKLFLICPGLDLSFSCSSVYIATFSNCRTNLNAMAYVRPCTWLCNRPR